MQQRRITQIASLGGLGLIIVMACLAVSFLRPTKAAAASCTVPTPDKGTVTSTLSNVTPGQYRVWSRMSSTTTNVGSNSYYLEVSNSSGTNCYTVGDSATATLPTAWNNDKTNWINYQNGTTSSVINVQLQATNTIKMIGKEDNVKLDRVMFLQSTTCEPSGTGANCETVADTTPPTISAVASGGVTTTGANVTWTTNEASTTQVEYGTTTSYGQTTTLNSTLTTSHTQALSGLTANTLYHYRVKSNDAAGNAAVSGDNTFTTTQVADTTAPTFSAITAGSITQTGATVTWNTNEASTTQIEYGTTTAYGQTTTINTSLVTNHTQAITGLTANTLYHYRVKSRDASNNTGTSTDSTFTTSATGAKPGDVNGDQVINVQDLSILASNYGQSGKTRAQGDLSGDGSVGVLDLSILSSNWGK